jgi:elongation factor 1 alpha-like protein
VSTEGNSNPANASKTAAVNVSKSVPASKKTAMTQTMETSSSSKHEGITEGHGKRTTQNGSSADSRKDVNLVESMRSVTLDGDHKDQRKGRELNEAPQVAVKRMPLDMYVPEAWMLPEAKKQKKQLLHLIVVGHVDAGKSTLMGHILHLLGRISQKDMHKNERESKQQVQFLHIFITILLVIYIHTVTLYSYGYWASLCRMSTHHCSLTGKRIICICLGPR